MTTVYCAWCYPDGTNSAMYSMPMPTYNPIQGLMGGLLPPSPETVANNLAATHANDCTISGAGLWAGYGDGSPTTYWLYKANP